MLAVAAVSLLAVDVVLTLTVRNQLMNDQDTALTEVIQSLAGNTRDLNQELLQQIGNANPLRSGDIGWSVVGPTGNTSVVVKSPRHPGAVPAVGFPPPTSGSATVSDASGSRDTYTVRGLAVNIVGQGPGYLVAWLPTAEVKQTVNRVLVLEAVFTLALLILLGGIASVIIRRELRPLESVAEAADEIAGGELDRRVDVEDSVTEVGRLGAAFNGMLDGIGALLAERTAGENRMRQFLADASHELRTPVAAVQGYAELYRAGALADPAAVDRAMDRMGFEARRMGALVDDLLTLIKADSTRRGPREPVKVAELLTGVIDDAAVIDRTRTWRLAGGGTPVTVFGDRLRLHQLFANLLANVRTHTPTGTTATISILPGPTEVAVLVSDDGPGVTDEDLPKLFDRFYRAEKSRSREKGGTGLGLSIVAKACQQLGIELAVASELGRGSTFTLHFPA